jgi:hypothetical protein
MKDFGVNSDSMAIISLGQARHKQITEPCIPSPVAERLRRTDQSFDD